MIYRIPANAVSMLGQRRRRWANIETTLGTRKSLNQLNVGFTARLLTYRLRRWPSNKQTLVHSFVFEHSIRGMKKQAFSSVNM